MSLLYVFSAEKRLDPQRMENAEITVTTVYSLDILILYQGIGSIPVKAE